MDYFSLKIHLFICMFYRGRCGSFVGFIQYSVFDLSIHSDLGFPTCYLLDIVKICFLLLYLECTTWYEDDAT